MIASSCSRENGGSLVVIAVLYTGDYQPAHEPRRTCCIIQQCRHAPDALATLTGLPLGAIMRAKESHAGWGRLSNAIGGHAMVKATIERADGAPSGYKEAPGPPALPLLGHLPMMRRQESFQM